MSHKVTVAQQGAVGCGWHPCRNGAHAVLLTALCGCGAWQAVLTHGLCVQAAHASYMSNHRGYTSLAALPQASPHCELHSMILPAAVAQQWTRGPTVLRMAINLDIVGPQIEPSAFPSLPSDDFTVGNPCIM